jgi:hypothetical protein
MHICCIVDADEFRLLLMPVGSNTSSTSLTASHAHDTRLLPPAPIEATQKYETFFNIFRKLLSYLFRKSPARQSYLFGSNVKQRGDGEANNMNMSTSTLLPSSPPAVLSSTTTADTNELMKKIDYFIKVKMIFLNTKNICSFD